MTPEPEWVDLDLPSGTLWRNRNLGANSKEEAGLFFAWGNNTGYTPSEGHSFSLANYQGSAGASVQTDLPPERDCATALLGAPARLPSKDDYQELVDNTTHQWVRLNGRLGLLFTSLTNGRTLFIPAAGYINDTAYSELDVHGYFWTKSIHGEGDAYCFGFTASSLNTGSYIYRYLGLTARAVRSA